MNFPILMNINEPLVACTPVGKPQSGLGIASWEILEGGKVIEFTLRKGIKFSTGDPLTTADVEFSHERSMGKNNEYKVSLRTLTGFEVIDDYKCRFIFEEPDALFLPLSSALFCISSKSYYDRVGEEEFTNHPVGTGPYKFVEWKLGEYLDLEANEDYWGGAPAVKQARFVFAAEDSTRVAMLRAGEVDMIMDTPWELVKDLEEAGFKTVKVPINIGGIGISFHCKNPNVPWYDKRVRQAIIYAVDRKSLAENVFFGIPPIYAELAPWEVGYDPELKPYPYDQDKAKALLAEAGYADGFEMPLYHGTSGEVKTLADAVILALKAIGIKCNAIAVEGPEYMENNFKWHADPTAEAVQVMGLGLAQWQDPLRPLGLFIDSEGAMALYSNEQTDALYAKARATYDETQRAELIKQIIRIVDEDVPIYALTSGGVIVTMKPNITDFTSSPTGFVQIPVNSVKIK